MVLTSFLVSWTIFISRTWRCFLKPPAFVYQKIYTAISTTCDISGMVVLKVSGCWWSTKTLLGVITYSS